MRTVRVCMVDLPGRRYIDRFSFPFCVCASICMIYSFSPGPCPYTDLLQKCDPRQIYPRHILYPVSHAKLKHIGISCPLPAFDSQILCRTAVSGRCAYFATNGSGTHLPKRCAGPGDIWRRIHLHSLPSARLRQRRSITDRGLHSLSILQHSDHKKQKYRNHQRRFHGQCPLPAFPSDRRSKKECSYTL